MKHEHYMDMNRLSDWSVEQINELLDTCLLLKEMEEKGVRLPLLKDVVLAMMFDQQSTRTRVSFETAMTQLGGPCHVPGMAALCMPVLAKRISLRRLPSFLAWLMPS